MLLHRHPVFMARKLLFQRRRSIKFMRVTLFMLAAISGFFGTGNAQIFQTKSISISRISLDEAKAYEKIRTNVGTLQSKLVMVQVASFTPGDVELDLFDGVRKLFPASWDSRESRWKGSDSNGNRFSIRHVNGRYVGYVYHQGRRYILSPLSNGVSALYEQDPHFECGVQDMEASRAH